MSPRKVALPSYDRQPEGTELFLVFPRFDQNRPGRGARIHSTRSVQGSFLHIGGFRVVELRALADVVQKDGSRSFRIPIARIRSNMLKRDK